MEIAWLVFDSAIAPDRGLAPEATATGQALATAVGAATVIRLDLAWALFLPKDLGADGLEVPAGNPRTTMRPLLAWLQAALGWAATGPHPQPLVVVSPRLSPAAEEWARRQLSFYASRLGIRRLAEPLPAAVLAEEWQRFREGESSPWEDGFWAPVIHLREQPGALLARTQKSQGGGLYLFLTAAIGSDRLAVQTYRLAPFAHGNRLHAHSDLDELYLVLEGAGEVVTEHRRIPVAAGDLVAKPRGSRLAMEFVAGAGGMTVLDIEGWRDFSQTDAVLYPQHDEWYLRGPGLELACSAEAMVPGQEVMAHYLDHYRRRPDGSRRPAP